MAETKVCRDCGETKPIDQFYSDKARLDGRSIRCKACFNAKLATYQMRPPRHKTPPGMKRCTLCKATKPESEFSQDRAFHDGLSRKCKTCSNARSSAYAKANRKALNAKQLARYHANKDRYHDYHLKRHYGMTKGEYALMFEAQGGRCAICGSTNPSTRTKRLDIDHCHETGRIRGLLCGNCNRGIGYLKHSINVLQSAIKYLGSTKSPGV